MMASKSFILQRPDKPRRRAQQGESEKFHLYVNRRFWFIELFHIKKATEQE